MRGVLGDALGVEDQVVVDLLIARQRVVEGDVEQMDKSVATDRHNRAVDIGANACAAQLQLGLQGLGGYQPEHDSRGFEAAQQRAGQYQGQRRCIGYRQRRRHHKIGRSG
ncbi:hypothetical protein D9M71_673440 [compost metagenome]